jgi:hypothetical protein
LDLFDTGREVAEDSLALEDFVSMGSCDLRRGEV